MNQDESSQMKRDNSVTIADAEVKRGQEWIHSELGQAKLEKVSREIRTTMKQLQEGNRTVSLLLKQRFGY